MIWVVLYHVPMDAKTDNRKSNHCSVVPPPPNQRGSGHFCSLIAYDVNPTKMQLSSAR